MTASVFNVRCVPGVWTGTLALLPACLLLPVASAMAGDSSLLGGASIGAFYDSNHGLKNGDPLELAGTSQQINLKYESISEFASAGSRVQFVDEYLQDYPDQENDRASVSLTGKLRGQRSQLYSNFDAQFDSTLAADVQLAGPPLPDKKDRVRLVEAAGYSYEWSERDLLGLDLSAETVDYRDVVAENRITEYDYYGASLGYTRSVSEQFSVQLAVFGNELANATDAGGSRTIGEKITLHYQWSSQSDARLSAGSRQTDYRSVIWIPGYRAVEINSDERGTVADLMWNYTGDTFHSRLAGSYDMSPNSVGALVRRTSLDWGLDFPVSYFQSVSVALAGLQQRSELDFATVDDVDTLQMDASWRYRLTPDASVAVRVRRAERLQVSNDEIARSNMILLECVLADYALWF